MEYREISKMLDQYREEKNEPKFWIIKKIFIYVWICFLVTFIKSLIDDANEKAIFERKYKTVIKKNWLGVETYEYHERE
jgi:hypothetical protein